MRGLVRGGSSAALALASSLALAAACGDAEPAEAPAPATTVAPAGPDPSLLVSIELRAIAGEERRMIEQRALVTAQLESSLTDLPGVVPVVENVPLSPGLVGRLESDAARWTLRVRVDQPERESMVIALELCPPAGAECSAFAEVTGDDPTPAIALLMPKLSSALGRPPAAGATAMWTKTPSRDRYARLILGRAAASWYRLIPPVPVDNMHDRRLDPVERAIFIDPRMALGHWIAGRRRFEAKDYAGARNAFSRAGLAAPDRTIHLAEEATALGALGQTEPSWMAWAQVAARAPDDPRYVVPRARSLLALERGSEAVALLDALGPRFQGDPRVLELRVAIAEQVGGGPDDPSLLERWQAADPNSAEPVRRRISILVRRPALTEAYALLPELERRGAAEEASRLRLALATSLGQLDEAIQTAEALGMSGMASSLRLRRALEQGAPPATMVALAIDPIAHVAVGEAFLRGGDAAQALSIADAVLAGEPWLAEALALRAHALTALGRTDDANATWAALRGADPGWIRSSTTAPI